MTPRSWIERRRSPTPRGRALEAALAAGCLHLWTTVALFAVGNQTLLPTPVDAVGSFNNDSLRYETAAGFLARLLERRGPLAWLTATATVYEKAYSLCFAAFGPLVGNNIIAAEPLNVLLFLAAIAGVYAIGRELFGPRAAAAAALAAAMLPSYLCHSTQIVRDTFFVPALVWFAFAALTWTTRTFDPRRALGAGAAGAALGVAAWFVRSAWWPFLVLACVLALASLVARMAVERRLLAANLAAGALALAAVIAAPQLERVPGVRPSTEYVRSEEPAVRDAGWVGSLDARRAKFYRYAAGSTFDASVRYSSPLDVLAHAPRALAVGLLAPFPSDWTAEGGTFGRAGRLLAGVEMSLVYAAEIAAAFVLWRGRRRPEVWLIALTAAAGALALGLAVANLGALYRMRLALWLLLAPLAAPAVTRETRAPTNSGDARLDSETVADG